MQAARRVDFRLALRIEDFLLDFASARIALHLLLR